MQALNNLIQAACSGDVEQVRRLLQADPTTVHARDPYLQSTPLHYAAHRGYLEIVQLLLTAGADVTAREGSSDTTPLHWAAEGGHLEVARLLVEHGADVNAIDGWHNLGPVGWAIAIESGNCHAQTARREVADFLLSRGAQLDIFAAIAWGKPDVVRALIETDRAVLRQRLGVVDQQQQPLHFAVQNDRPDMVALLLDVGADLHATTAWGLTAFCLAATQQRQQIVEVLRARDGDSDLSATIVLDQLDRAKALLDADSTLVGPAGPYRRLLHFTIQQGLAEAASLLLRSGADPNAPAEYLHHEIICTLSPLHVAAWHGQLEVARVLLDHDADLHAKHAQYESTPFIWAKWHHQLRVMLDVRREVHQQSGHEEPIGRDRECIGVDRPIVRIQGVGLARACLMKKHAAIHGKSFLGLGQLVWRFGAADPLVEAQDRGVPALLRNRRVLKNQPGDPLGVGRRDAHSDRTADVVHVQDDWPGRALGDERVDDHGDVVEGRSQDSRGRRIAVPHAGIVGRDDMKPIRQERNEVVERVRRRGKTVQQDDGRLRRVPGLAVEDPKARNVGGVEVHKLFLLWSAPYLRSALVDANSFAMLSRACQTRH